MPEYLAPGVYVEEIDTGSKPIEGVSTSTAGMIGVAERGPVNVPILLTSMGDYTRWFGERLSFADFEDLCYLPLAVEGFFTNGGKRLYLTRVLDTEGATFAEGDLFDRGEPGFADTTILRSAGELTGTLGNLPLIYVLDTSALSVNDWIRIGDGSRSEYRQVAVVGTPANNTHVPLAFPLSLSHSEGVPNSVQEFAVAAAAGYSAPFTVAAATAVGDPSIEIIGALPADIVLLAGAGNALLEIGGASGEHRLVGSVTVINPTQARVNLLGGGLMLSHTSGETVRVLAIGAFVQQSMLAPAAGAGDRLVFVDNRGGNLDTPGNLVIFEGSNPDPARREVRRIGALGTLSLSTGAYEEYAAGSTVQGVTLGDDDRLLQVAGAIGDTSITLQSNAIGSLTAGTQLQIGTGATQEQVTVVSTTVPNVVNISALGNVQPIGAPVVPDFSVKSLNAATAVGAVVISLGNRVSLSIGDVLRIGDPADDEYAVIAGIPNRAAAGADPGNVLLATGLRRAHANGTAVRRQNAAALAALQPTTLALTAAANSQQLLVTDGTGFVANGLIRVSTATGETFFHRLSANFVVAASVAEIQLDRPLNRAHPEGSVLVERSPLLEIQALDAGAWGNRIRISAEDERPGVIPRTRLASVIDATHIRLDSASGVEAGTILELLNPLADDAVTGDPLKVESVDRQANFTITLRAPGLSAAQQAAQVAATGAGTRLGVRSREFRITVHLLHQPDPARPSRNELVIDAEVYRYLSLDPRHSRYVPRVIGDIAGAVRLSDRRPEGESNYVRVHDPNPVETVRVGPETLVDILPSGQRRAARHPLFGGDDSLATLTDGVFIGTDNIDPELRTGLFTLNNVEDISIVAAPGRIGASLQGALISHCENQRYRFAVLDGPAPPLDAIPDVQNQRQQFDTKYAALYHPWLLIDDPYPTNLQDINTFAIPPAGHLVGLYARTDIERGVHKAPANEVVRGIVGLQRTINKGEQEILNPFPSNINVIRDFRPNNRGIRVWGGRVITSDPDWKYVNVRRLLIFIERSIDIGLQWVVFEPNADPLWARVRRSISNFLTTVWRDGALEGTKREEAYFVKCDRTTMTQTDIDNGRLIVVIGVAPVKPAEFVIIRIGLWTAHAEE
jgi:phage tail sheath protein FI